MSKKDGGPAFSGTYKKRSDYGRGPVEEYHDKGMSLRDYFAAKAMQQLVSDYEVFRYDSAIDTAARDAYRMADAMLAEREK